MKTLYIHGYKSSLIEPKREIIEKYSEVIAPNRDYDSEPNIYTELKKIIQENSINHIIGSSMGGRLAYHLSTELNLPCLLFNPALSGEFINIKNYSTHFKPFKKIILGAQDNIVDPYQNFTWLTTHDKSEFTVKWIPDLAHQIPVDIFRKEVDQFYKCLKVLNF